MAKFKRDQAWRGRSAGGARVGGGLSARPVGLLRAWGTHPAGQGRAAQRGGDDGSVVRFMPQQAQAQAWCDAPFWRISRFGMGLESAMQALSRVALQQVWLARATRLIHYPMPFK